MTAVTATLAIAGGTAAHAIVFPADATGWIGLACLTVFYCLAIISLFFVLPKLPSTHTAALNIEPIALLVLAWLILGNTVTPLQVAGAFLTVGAIVWLGLSKR
jgi:drug/metabolite transporter (DMT)-like permease